jgi:hypothetical protein
VKRRLFEFERPCERSRGVRFVPEALRLMPRNLALKCARDEIVAAGKPSIVVRPFADLTADPEQKYFADGMVEKNL